MSRFRASRLWFATCRRLLFGTASAPAYYAVGLAGILVASYLGIIFALTLGEVVNYAVQGHAALAIRSSLGCVLAVVGSQWASFLGLAAVNGVVTRGSISLTENIVWKTLRAKYKAVKQQYSSADIRSIATQDVDAVAGLWSNRLLNMLESLVTAILASAVVWNVSPALVVIPYAAAGLSLVVGRRLLRDTARLSYEQSRSGARLRANVMTYLSSQDVVRAYGLTDHLLKCLAEAGAQFQKLALTGVRRQALSSLISGVCNVAGIGSVMAIGFVEVARGSIPAGMVVSTILLVNRIAWPVAGLTSFFSDVARIYGNGIRVGEALQMPAEEPALSGNLENTDVDEEQPLVRFSNVHFAYPSGKRVLEGVSFDIWKSECVAIVGPNGSGKSTLIKLLLRLYEPDEGTISFRGNDIKTLDPSDLRKGLAYVPQTPVLFEGTVRDNVRYGNLYATNEDILNVAHMCGLDNCGLKDGLKTIVGERGENISGGQQQRIQLARALIRPAELLLLDEPTTFLDRETEEGLYETLETIMRLQRTVIVITHNQRLISQASRVLELSNGRLHEGDSGLTGHWPASLGGST